VHDDCYGEVETVHDCSPKVFNFYSYTGKVGEVNCTDKADSCNLRICQCDKEATECFYSNLATYNKEYKTTFNRSTCNDTSSEHC
jgi:hypothetical protein